MKGTSAPAGGSLSGPEDAQNIPAPDFLEILGPVALLEQPLGDAGIVGGVFETLNAPTAIEIDPDTDVIHPRNLQRVKQVLHEILEGGAGHGKLTVNLAALRREC